MTKYNKKLEEAPYEVGRSNPKYPWIRGESDILGATTTIYADPDNYKESFTEKFNHDASFQINETADEDKKGLTNSLNHEVRQYSSGGHSLTTDGHQDNASLEGKGSLRENFAGDRGSSAKGNIYSGAGESNVNGSDAGQYNADNGDTYTTTTGNRISEHTGNTATHFEGDLTQSVTGNKISMIDGEIGLHVQGGNMDIQVETGRFRVKSGAKLLIESVTEIEIKVGSSIINITSSGITINSSGDIVTQGSATKVQGGGIVAPPTTFI